MRQSSPFILLFGFLICANVFAADGDVIEEDESQFGQIGEMSPGLPGTAGGAQDTSVSPATTAEAAEVTRGYLHEETVGIKPQLGIITYTDALGDNTSRFVGGVTADMNLTRFVNEDWSSFYVGPATGLVYSHLGAASSNFVGTAPSIAPTGVGAGANLLIIPANLKVGYTLGERFRVSARGGGNIIYRSVGNSMSVGDSSGLSDSVWRIFPNVGADVEFEVAKNMALMLRPDVTLTPGDEFFTGTIALGISLG